MLVCAFSPTPVPPRTVFRTVETSEGPTVSSNVLERAIFAVLHKFPEAYRAVIEEMRRLMPLPEGVT